MWPKRGLLSNRLIALFLYDELGVLCVGLPRLPQPQPNNLAPEESD